MRDSFRINRWIFASSIFVALLGTTLSQFSPRGILNGDSNTAFALYIGSILIAAGVILGQILTKHWKSREPAGKIPYEGVFLLLWFFLTLFLARGGLRFAFFLSPALLILSSWGIVEASRRLVPKPYQPPVMVCLIASILCWEILAFNDNILMFLLKAVSFSALSLSLPLRVNLNLTMALVFAIIGLGIFILRGRLKRTRIAGWVALLLFAAMMTGSVPYMAQYGYAKNAYSAAKQKGPLFSQDLVKSLEWAKENLEKDAVVASWWDYGAWINTFADKSTLTGYT